MPTSRVGAAEVSVARAPIEVPFDPATIIPHRPPFLFVSTVTSVAPGQRATGRWHVAADSWFFQGHFPGRPTLPGVLMIESLAQLGAAALLLDDRFAGMLPLFGGIDRARFRRQVGPGETLDLEIELVRLSRRGGKGTGVASVGGEACAEADLLFIVVDSSGVGP